VLFNDIYELEFGREILYQEGLLKNVN